jgi:hypothetical protein
MTPVEFLRAVWPRTGIYCLATPRSSGAYQHWTFDTIDEVASYLDKTLDPTRVDIYFNIHSLREKQVPHKDPGLAAQGRTQVRVQRNMLAARCFFFDLDIGPEPHKYDDQVEAIAGLRAFIKATGLPTPLVATSGGGFHVYWLLSDDLPTEEWRTHATHLRQLAQHYGLKADPSRTTDTSSVLRVVGTFNHKDRLNPKPVYIMAPGTETATGVFVNLVNKAIIEAGVQPQEAPKLLQAESQLGGNLDIEYDGPRPKMTAIFTACAQMRRLALAKGLFSEPEWYHSVIGVGRFTEGGNRDIHKLSTGHPGYSESACNAKIKQSEGAQKGPSSCASVAFASAMGDSLCVGCPHQGRVYGPIQAALKVDEKPAPQVQQLVAGQTVTLLIPPPPKPFARTKDGIVVAVKNADGSEEHNTIYDYDLYPVRRLSNAQAETEQHIWHVELPNGESKNFTLDADMLYDLRKFVVAIAHQGIYPHKGHLPTLQEYMVAYIAQLQKLASADAQCNHLGWADDHSQFILPDKILLADGGARPAQLSLGAQRASANIHQRGDLTKQVQLMEFYNHHAYLPNQFFILAGLAAPIFYATGHHGVIINASGEAGASKSTSLYTAASFWGQPELYPINGTNNGATVRGRNERVTVLANLPVCVDEITHMPVKDAVDLAMSITQPGHRIRLQTDGTERAHLGSYKATIMLATANNSLHSVLSHDNAHGTAGSMRVFEILFKATSVHEKYEADDFMFHLRHNYGHIGEQFMAYVVQNLDAVVARVRAVMREIDQECKIQSAERFWSATIAVVLTAGEIARQLGLLPFDVGALKQWVVSYQVPHMRGVVMSEYSDPLSSLADYLETINNNIIVVRKYQGQVAGVNIERRPLGALLAHYDLDDNMLYVLKKGFKDYCARTGANATAIINDLHIPRDGERIVPQRDTRRVLGAGTEFAKSQTWCFAVNMSHQAVSGTVNLTAVTGGGQGAATDGRASLHVVQ